MKRQAGRPSKNNESPVGIHLKGKQSMDILGEETGDSRNQIHRYIRLTNLIPELLTLVDDGKIALRPAVEISYLSEKEQNNLYKTIVFAEATPSLAQAIKMRSFSKEGKLSGEVIESIMCEEKPNQREKITFKAENIRRFVPSNYTAKQTEEYVLKALDFYKRHLDKQKDRGR